MVVSSGLVGVSDHVFSPSLCCSAPSVVIHVCVVSGWRQPKQSKILVTLRRAASTGFWLVFRVSAKDDVNISINRSALPKPFKVACVNRATHLNRSKSEREPRERESNENAESDRVSRTIPRNPKTQKSKNPTVSRYTVHVLMLV